MARLAPALAGRPMRGVIEALALGVRQHISAAQWAVLRATGTSHVMAISGLHIGLLAGWAFLLVRWLALRIGAMRMATRLAALAALRAPGPGGALLRQLADALDWGWALLVRAAHVPWASLHWPLAGPATLMLALAGMVLLTAPLPRRLRALGLLFALPEAVGWQPPGQGIAPGRFRLTVLDVGQGLASGVITARHILVFDAGQAYRTAFHTGCAVVVLFLRQRHRSRIDRLLISPGDRDHIGGASAIAAALNVRQREGAVSAHPCRAGAVMVSISSCCIRTRARRRPRSPATSAPACRVRMAPGPVRCDRRHRGARRNGAGRDCAVAPGDPCSGDVPPRQRDFVVGRFHRRRGAGGGAGVGRLAQSLGVSAARSGRTLSYARRGIVRHRHRRRADRDLAARPSPAAITWDVATNKRRTGADFGLGRR